MKDDRATKHEKRARDASDDEGAEHGAGDDLERGGDEDRREADDDEGDDDEADDDEGDDDEGDDDEADDDDAPRREGAGAGERAPRARAARPPATPLQLGVLAVLFAAGIVYAVNGMMNLRARQGVIEICLAEDGRLERAIAQRSELDLPVTDWMVALYEARRRYVTELCDRTIERLAWWRWNIGAGVAADISLATAQDISRSLEVASVSCEEEVRGLEAELERHAARRGADAALEARVRDVTAGQLEACAGLRRAVQHSRPGFWPALEAPSVGETASRMAELMPETPPDYESVEPGGGR